MPLVVQYLLFGMTVVSFLGAAFVYLRGAKDKGTIETLDRNNEALSERVGILESEIQRRDAADLIRDASDLATKERLDALERENEVLRTVDGAAEKITAVMRALNQHHTKAMGGIDTLTAILQSNAEGLDRIHLDLVQMGRLESKEPDDG